MSAPPILNLVDVIALGVIAIGMLQGYFRGFSGEIARLVGLAVAFFLGLRFYQPIGQWFFAHTRLADEPARALAFLGTVLAATLCMLIVRKVLKRIMQVAIEKGPDRAGGVLLGAVRAGVVVVIVFLALNLWPNETLNRMFGEESLIGRGLLRVFPELSTPRGDQDPGFEATSATMGPNRGCTSHV